jgi:hypothetical protein
VLRDSRLEPALTAYDLDDADERLLAELNGQPGAAAVSERGPNWVLGRSARAGLSVLALLPPVLGRPG